VICGAMVDSLTAGEQSSCFEVINGWEDSPGRYMQASFRLKVTWLYDKGVVAAMEPVFAGYLARAKPLNLEEWAICPTMTELTENISRLTAALQRGAS
jgi:hypothetical protein